MSIESTNTMDMPCTRKSLRRDFERLRVNEGDIILLHASLSSLGWVIGGAEAVVLALLDILGDTGTLVVPTFTLGNSDPASWEQTPMPAQWVQAYRQSMLPYSPSTTPSTRMGAIAETVRTWPGALRSAHPQTSFAAVGPAAAFLLAEHALDCRFGEHSPLAQIEAAGALVLLLGVGFGDCSAFHLAQTRLWGEMEEVSFVIQGYRGRQWFTVQDRGIGHQWVVEIGINYVRVRGLPLDQMVGNAPSFLSPLADAVSFAESELEGYES